MVAIFCLRLAAGLIGSLVLFCPSHVNPRFYRVHFLVAMALAAATAFLAREVPGAWKWGLYAAIALAGAGFLAWSLEGAPLGRILIGLTAAALAVTLGLASPVRLQTPAAGQARIRSTAADLGPPGWYRAGILADELTSAALLGCATTAMLMGHSYLIAPSMSLTPLLRLLAGLSGSLLLRMVLASASLWSWASGDMPISPGSDTMLWLPVRWGVGLVAPLVLAWMARAATKIHSTQSATGILYVVVIFCFVGELTSQLLYNDTGYFL
jgi:hypothetical protein